VISNPGFLWTIMFFLVCLGPLIFLHEMGHYLVGRWCGIKSDVFSIGFGNEIFGWTDKRGTRWKVGWMPLGGYVRFAGDMSPASEPNEEWKALPDAERAVTFQSKPLWKRAITVAAGPFANFLVAFIVYLGLIAALGVPRAPNVVGGVAPLSAAERAGFHDGDKIIAINGRATPQFQDVGIYVMMRPRQLMTFSVVRSGSSMTIVAAPDELVETDRFGNKSSIGRMGIKPGPAEVYHPRLFELPGAALHQTWGILQSTMDGLGQIVTGRRSLKELGGPVQTAKLSGQVATMGWITFISFMAFVSINLGFINLLPIPILDGGHLFFYGVEALFRRPVTAQVQEWAFRCGFLLLASLMLFATLNDLDRIGLWQRLSGLIGLT
jgi:regulator of sigma E protease